MFPESRKHFSISFEGFAVQLGLSNYDEEDEVPDNCNDVKFMQLAKGQLLGFWEVKTCTSCKCLRIITTCGEMTT